MIQGRFRSCLTTFVAACVCGLTVNTPMAASAVSRSDEEAITREMNQRLTHLAQAANWNEFLKSHSSEFPSIELSTEMKTRVAVEKEEWQINSSSFTLGLGFRQTLIQAPLERVEKIVSSPTLFKNLFGLDAEANLSTPSTTSDALTPFSARIFKKVPVLPDQDYVLNYTPKREGNFVFIRAKLSEDKKAFALRDNLMVLEKTEAGVILREISMIYILRWYLRALGPQVRSVMTTELAKVTDSVKCLSEKSEPLEPSQAHSCWVSVASKR